jgi:hypothetical protein
MNLLMGSNKINPLPHLLAPSFASQISHPLPPPAKSRFLRFASIAAHLRLHLHYAPSSHVESDFHQAAPHPTVPWRIFSPWSRLGASSSTSNDDNQTTFRSHNVHLLHYSVNSSSTVAFHGPSIRVYVPWVPLWPSNNELIVVLVSVIVVVLIRPKDQVVI